MKKVRIGDEVFNFHNAAKTGQMKKGNAYLHNDKVYVFWGAVPRTVPGIYKSLETGKFGIKPYPKGQEVTPDDVYDDEDVDSEERASVPKSGDIFDEIMGDREHIVRQAERPMLSVEEQGEIYAPEISEDDNILVRITKSILKDRQINIKVLLPRFKDQMEMNNFKRSLRIHNKMSIERFEKWMEVLDVEWDLTYIDKHKEKGGE